MSNRRALSFLAFVALALLVSASAFAAEAPSAPVSEKDFLASLRAPDTPSPKQPDLDGVGTPAPILKHGYNCYYIGSRDCVPCSIGKVTNCDDYRCYYGGQWHTDSICYTCANYC